jgi:hypothetical protein
VRAAQQRGDTHGLSPEELAFCDAVAENGSAVDAMGSEQLRKNATVLTGSATGVVRLATALSPPQQKIQLQRNSCGR